MADVELAGVVTDDHRIPQEAVRNHATHERPFGGDLNRIGVDLQLAHAEPLDVSTP